MNIQDYLKQVEGFGEAVDEREVLKRVFGDLSIPKDFAENFVKLLHPREIRVSVVEINDETPTTKTFRLAPKPEEGEGYLPPFRAGQYINWTARIGNVRTGRAFSIASPPHERGFYEVTVRRIEGGFLSPHLLDSVKRGDEFTISGPAGNFYHEPLTDGNRLVFIAGGSGITPFRSIIREVADRGLDHEITLFYGSRTPDDIIFDRELSKISERHSNIRAHFVISDPPKGYAGKTGFITAGLIKESVKDIGGATFYLCGPDVMYRFVEEELQKLGVTKRKIKKEASGPPADISAEPGWPREVSKEATFSIVVNGEKTIPARVGETVMTSLERSGLYIPQLCRSGECSLCRTKVLAGKVFMPDRVLIRESDHWYGYIHACFAYPLSDLEIRY